ncbi:hypothetical protein H072_9119 [Dactylellina haptotyla CBS 200.50]|uniref:Uncharacterized protein n=1 Tax=Dactylellina haptotyla (strain CBS 200.50) TaxID=1284197 RepID=S8BPQ5_DACHA|nr:hypothetical protein H072_9119 [Dactylellina haptotyla CBS 200.50]
MPFDFKKYDAKCAAMSPAELQLQWEHYTRLISGAATSTAVSGAALPLTMGVSVVGVAMAAPAIHNARKKREIIERHLNNHGTTHVTRKRDVLTSVAISGTIGVVTMGASSIATDALTNHAAEYGIQQVVENELAVKIGTHIAFDAAALGVEHAHTESRRKKEALKAQQQGLATPTDGKTGQVQEMIPPDGFYPAVPVPLGYSTVQAGEPSSVSYALPTEQVPFSPLPVQTPVQEYPPPPQYPGLPMSPPSEKKVFIPPPPPPPVPNFASDFKFNPVVLDQASSDQDSQGPPPTYVSPPGSAPVIIEKSDGPVYQPSQPYPQQHYPPPPVQPTAVASYPSYPGTTIDRAGPSQAPQSAAASDASQGVTQTELVAPPISAAPQNTPPTPVVPSTVNAPVQPQNITYHQAQAVAPPPPSPFTQPPPQDQFMPTMYDQGNAPIFQHKNSIPAPQTPITPYNTQPQTPVVQNQNPHRLSLQHQGSFPPPPPPLQQAPVHTQSFPPPPPPPQSYVPQAAPIQHPYFPPNSFPPPPAAASYPMTPVQTPGTSYAQYIPSQHPPPSAYPTGYPTPMQTPFAEYPNQTQQYLPEKQGFPQYQDVPIPGPQILSQQGQYTQNQPMMPQYQYQPSGYPAQQGMYGY